MTELREVAALVASGCKMVLSTTKPGLQVYTGSSLNPPLKPFQGIALELQLWPDTRILRVSMGRRNIQTNDRVHFYQYSQL